MPAVLIHGVPDTFRVWDLVREHLSRKDIVTLSLPGFNSPIREGFTATKEEYVDWIISQLERIAEPVDLVGHDWGCILAMRVASLRPDLVRTWAAGSGPISKNYEWHPLAKIWQTPGKGEAWFRDLDHEDMAEFMAKAGLPLAWARDTVSRVDAKMGDCILRLYRSAVNVGAEWQRDLRSVRSPGLVFWGQEDSACPVAFADQLAADAHAASLLKLESKHWTIVERAAQVASAFEQHWTSRT